LDEQSLRIYEAYGENWHDYDESDDD